MLGWSLGGAVAMRWAALHPDRIARLVLVATTPSFVARDDWPHAMRDETLQKFGDELRAAYRLTLQRFLTLQTQGSDGGRATLAALRHQLFARGAPTAAALDQSLELVRGIDLRALAPTIRAPALVVAGDRDTLAPRAAGAWLAEALPNARFAEIAGRRARAVPVASRGLSRRRGAVSRWPLTRAFPPPTRATSIRARSGARSAAPRRPTTRQRCFSARWPRGWPSASTT